MKKKIFSLLLAVMLICVVLVNADTTLAFLMASTRTITYTFSPADIAYKLTLKANADGANPSEKSYVKNSATLEATFDVEVPTKTGYTFVGWYYDAECKDEHTEAPGITVKMEFADKKTTKPQQDQVELTLYAKWKQTDFKISFNTQVDGLAVNPVDKTITYGQAYGALPTPERTGYTFNGWTLDAAGNSKVNSDTVVNIAEDHVLYAQWSANTYTVSFDMQAEGVDNPDAITVTYDGTYGTLPVVNRTGYEFSGWSIGKTGDNYVSANTKVTTAADHTLYAQWNAKTYTIKFHANGGVGSMADMTVEYDKMVELTPNAFTMDDHSFMGWALEGDMTKVVYPDKQSVTNLKESGTVDLYAVWAQDTHTVTFDYIKEVNGSGSVDSMQVLYGQPYGALPEYPTANEMLFVGWFTDKTGGMRVYPETIVNRKDDHTLYAHWESSPANDVIDGLVVKNNPDENRDGIVDAVFLSFICQSSFEKFNIPITGLVPGQTYTLTYTASNNASFGDYYSGYSSSRYGSYILPTATNSAGNINDAVASQILKTWNDRKEADGNNDGSHAAINDNELHGPFNRTITFTATAETMYWAWEFGLIQDNIRYEYNITDIVLEPVVPTIKFADKKLVLASGSAAKVFADTSTAFRNNFKFDGESYAETMYFPITGLTAGTTYTITFSHKMTGALINSDYDYGCGISSVAPTAYGSRMANLGATWISGTKVFTNLNTEESVTFTFKATGNTAYWVWNLANCSDSTVCTIDIQVTNFRASHSGGGSITYYNGN